MYQNNLFVASAKQGVAIKNSLCYVLSVKCGVHKWHFNFIEEKGEKLWHSKTKV
jgi:hypothetical protein